MSFAVERRPFTRAAVASAVTTVLALFTAAPANTAPTRDDLTEDAVQAYVYGYPLVLMKATEQSSTNVTGPDPSTIRAPINQFAKAAGVPGPDQKSVVSPNVDTLYTQAWLDLSAEPVVLHVPDTSGRYYLMPILSAWTDVIASVGKRTTGTQAGDYAITGPDWHGTLPAGVKQIKSPTDTAWILGRTQLNGPSDLPAVQALVSKYDIRPLSAYGDTSYKPPQGRVDPNVPGTAPKHLVQRMDAQAFYSRLAAAMAANPPAPADAPVVAKLARLGIHPGKAFDLDALPPDTAKALQRSLSEGQKRIQAAVTGLGKNVNGWRVATDLGTYGTNYTLRAATGWQGLGANLPQDAVYPINFVDSTGRQLSGADRYTIHFPPGRTPPANAFWSVTMYTPDGFLVPNPINRYEVGHTAEATANPDGSVDLYIQHDAPAADKKANWLPAPSGRFNVMLRMYWPRQSVINGTWAPPPIVRTQ
ncbi:DUF1254 domain-containing protein [Streptomyces sp. NPDC006393]|uniref:DUF1254 domain-containing protein n=1 Tax=Streptomyces sp. NPDC006393 TaxID=3156763 RepID=UPI00340C63FC